MTCVQVHASGTCRFNNTPKARKLICPKLAAEEYRPAIDFAVPSPRLLQYLRHAAGSYDGKPLETATVKVQLEQGSLALQMPNLVDKASGFADAMTAARCASSLPPAWRAVVSCTVFTEPVMCQQHACCSSDHCAALLMVGACVQRGWICIAYGGWRGRLGICRLHARICSCSMADDGRRSCKPSMRLQTATAISRRGRPARFESLCSSIDAPIAAMAGHRCQQRPCQRCACWI